MIIMPRGKMPDDDDFFPNFSFQILNSNLVFCFTFTSEQMQCRYLFNRVKILYKCERKKFPKFNNLITQEIWKQSRTLLRNGIKVLLKK